MDEEENIPGIKNSFKHYKNERSKLESYFRKVAEIRRCLESQYGRESAEISELKYEKYKLESENAILKFKCEKIEKEVKEMEEKNKSLRESTASMQQTIKGYKEKRLQNIEVFENEVANLCELFGTAAVLYDEDTIQTETENIYKSIEELRIEFEDTETELSKCKNELDDIVLYQAPHNPREAEIPLGQRKMVLNLFEAAHMKAENRLESAYKMKAAKEAELEQLVRRMEK